MGRIGAVCPLGFEDFGMYIQEHMSTPVYVFAYAYSFVSFYDLWKDRERDL